MNTDTKTKEQQLAILALHLTLVDQGLSSLPVEAMRMLAQSAKGKSGNPELEKRMEFLIAMAATYQARFPQTPQINVSTSTPVRA